MPKAKTVKELRAKRSHVQLPALKSKYARGMWHGKERALVRCGEGTTRVLVGIDDLSTWDEEELRRGRRRDKYGTFMGRDPVVVPKAVHDEMVKRTIEDAHKLLTENLQKAVEVLTEIVSDPDVDAKERLKGVSMVMDRVMGREPIVVAPAEGPAKWELALTGGIRSLKELGDKHTSDDLDDE
jgi:hypothetical protein